MKYVVLCHTKTIDRSDRNKFGEARDSINTHTLMQCVNRKDAERMADQLNGFDFHQIDDGPFTIERAYEVGVWVFTPKGKVTLTMSDVEMIASEYINPMAHVA